LNPFGAVVLTRRSRRSYDFCLRIPPESDVDITIGLVVQDCIDDLTGLSFDRKPFAALVTSAKTRSVFTRRFERETFECVSFFG
jgi:hypothetical protein